LEKIQISIHNVREGIRYFFMNIRIWHIIDVNPKVLKKYRLEPVEENMEQG